MFAGAEEGFDDTEGIKLALGAEEGCSDTEGLKEGPDEGSTEGLSEGEEDEGSGSKGTKYPPPQ